MAEESFSSTAIRFSGYAITGLFALSAVFALRLRRRLKPKSKWYNPQLLSGKTVLITGGNSGIGAATAKELARRQAKVIIACRTKSTSEQFIEEVKDDIGLSQISYQHLDLSSLTSVQTFVESLPVTNVDIVINNAAVWGSHERLSCDNMEQTFATNYLAHYYLSKLMLQKFSPKKIISVSSGLYTAGKLDPENLSALLAVPPVLNKPVYKQLYATSKLAQIYHTKELALRHPDTVCVAVHPGLCYTNLARYVKPTNILAKLLLKLLATIIPLVIRTAEEGARTSVYCCVEDVTSGQFYGDCRQEELKDVAKDDHLQKKLWEFSDQCLHKFE